MESMLNSISPIDGRYRKKTELLSAYFSEYSFIRYRILVEIEYLIALSKIELLDNLTEKEEIYLKSIYQNFNLEEAEKVKNIESEIKHDVKSIEYYIKDKINQSETLDEKGISIFVHFALTSQDINNTAYMLMIKSSIQKVLLPKINDILKKMKQYILDWAKIPLLTRTHGQAASPSFLGKEILVFYERIVIQSRKLNTIKYFTKFGGAVGNFNAHHMALPNIDWIDFSNKFINLLGLERNQYTTQVDHYDNYAEIFDNLKRINTIFIDFCVDIWLYISMNYFKLKVNNNEVGSSTMPHKVNPINFENAEGNFLLANNLLTFFSQRLPISRLQRDLTDSTILRNCGVAFSHILLALCSLEEGLGKLDINQEVLNKDLEENFSIVSEGIQTRLKVLGVENSYETFKNITRTNNKKDIKENIKKIIDSLEIEESEKKYLNTITPFNYTGIYRL
tara:strand:+ start:427 stop:1779 length:1353 start_codon:yes stop_codon:yes gene_type:complete